MTEEQKIDYVDVELTCERHTHRRRPYKKGDVLRLRTDQAKRLGDSCKSAAKGAEPANVDRDGKLI